MKGIISKNERTFNDVVVLAAFTFDLLIILLTLILLNPINDL